MQEKSIHNLDTVLLYYCGGSERIIVRMLTFRRIVVSLLLCIGAVFASMLPAMSPPSSPPSMTAPAGDHCSRMALAAASAAGGPAATCPAHAAYLHWLEWRERHPNAPSKYDKRSNGHALAGFALFFGASEPEPDPNFGGCGCDLATALAPNGCGWMHSQIWGVKRAPE